MDRREVVDALTEVAHILQRERVTARIYIVGGAAMAMAYDAERTTRDIYGIILDGHGPVVAAVAEVARGHGWPTSWLNEQASSYIPANPDRQQIVVFDHPSLRVLAASPRRLLALKARAARVTDVSDIVRLTELVGVTTADEVADVVLEHFPGESLSERSRKVIEDILHGGSGEPV